MNVIQKFEINNLARLFYRMMGYQVEEGYDFSKANHPAEKMVWEQARISREYWHFRFKGKTK